MESCPGWAESCLVKQGFEAYKKWKRNVSNFDLSEKLQKKVQKMGACAKEDIHFFEWKPKDAHNLVHQTWSESSLKKISQVK